MNFLAHPPNRLEDEKSPIYCILRQKALRNLGATQISYPFCLVTGVNFHPWLRTILKGTIASQAAVFLYSTVLSFLIMQPFSNQQSLLNSYQVLKMLAVNFCNNPAL